MSHPTLSDPREVTRRLFQTSEGRRDPYPLYHRLRELDPVHRSEELGAWLLTRYDDCAAILRDPRMGKDYPHQTEIRHGPDWRKHLSLSTFETSMLNVDGPAHGRLRGMVVKSFTRRTIDKLRPRIEAAVERFLDPFVEEGGGDLLKALAFPMPITVIGDLLGVPEADRAQFRGWVVDLTAVFEMRPTPEQMLAADEATRVIRAYFDELIQEKRKQPDDRLLCTLMNAGSGDDRLSHEELISIAQLVFIAGFETTTNLIGNGLYGLLRHPDQIELLRARPELFESLPNELLRYDGTAQLTVRDTLAEVEIGGRKIPAGETVYSVVAAGNHDPDEFPDPDAVDLMRPRFRPLSFGGGPHFCLGANLAKAEIEITIRELLERCPSVELAAEPRFRDRLTLRGLEALELRVTSGERQRLRSRAAPVDEAPVVRRTAAPASVGSVRPREGSDEDASWRNALRARVESGAGESLRRTGPELAATIVLLARAELFAACTPDEIAELAATAYPLTFETGERLCTEGGESLECYVVQEGEAEVTIGGRSVREIGEHDVVGERGVLEESARTATVTARSHMLTWAISRERLRALVERNPEAKAGMLAYMRERYLD